MGGEIDWNVPILGGEQMFQALRRLGRIAETRCLPRRIPRIQNSLAHQSRLERYLAWYAHFVKGDPAPPRPPEPPPTHDAKSAD